MIYTWYIRPIRFENSILNRIGRPIRFEIRFERKKNNSQVPILNIQSSQWSWLGTTAFHGENSETSVWHFVKFCGSLRQLTVNSVVDNEMKEKIKSSVQNID